LRNVGLLAALSLVLTATACGSDDDGSNSSTIAAAESTGAAPDTSAAASSSDAPSTDGTTASDAADTSTDAATAALYEKAKGEKDGITFYSINVESTNNKLAEEFNKLYPDAPDVEAVSVAAPDFPSRFGAENEAGTGTGDVIIDSFTNVIGYHEEGWLIDFDATQLPEASEYADKWSSPWGIVCQVGRHVISYNTDLAGDDPPTSLEDLLDPRYEGKIGLGSPAQAAYNLNAWYAFQKQYGDEFLARFPDQSPKWYASANEGIAAVASGEITAFWPSFVTLQGVVEKQGAPVASVVAEIKTGGGSGCSVSSKSKSPNTALLFLNFILSDLGQNINGENGQATVKPGVPSLDGYPEPYFMGDDYELPDSINAAAHKDEIIADLQAS
jgi:iron(III) transport system substrate-binding protein